MRVRNVAGLALAIAALTGEVLFALRTPHVQTAAAWTTSAEPAEQAAPDARVDGDLDGDGVPDLVVGAPGTDAVLVQLSRSGQVQYLHPYVSSAERSDFGASLAIGDFNGDGFLDLAVGAPHWRSGTTAHGQGAVFEYDGSPTGLQSAPLRLTAPDDGTVSGLGSVLAAADVDGDGRSDLVIGLHRQTWIVRGTSRGLDVSSRQVLSETTSSALAFADIDGDDTPDLVVGGARGAGQVCAYLSASGGVDSAPHCVSGPALGVHHGLGASLAIGDVDGDGHPDVVAGAPRDTDPQGRSTGSAVVLFGGSGSLTTARHERITEADLEDGARFGSSVAVANVTADRFAEIVIGAPGESVDGYSAAGAVYVLRGSASGVTDSPAQRITQSTPGVPGDPATDTRFGAVLHAGRLDGAGNSEIVVGAPQGSTAATGGGFVIRFPGGKHGLRTSRAESIDGSLPEGRLGQAIA